jgi:hypothetical protein
VDLVERGRWLSRRKRGELEPGLFTLLDERGIDFPGIVLLDQAVAHLRRRQPDLPVQTGDERGEPLALGSGVDDGCGGELIDGVLDQHSHVVGGYVPRWFRTAVVNCPSAFSKSDALVTAFGISRASHLQAWPTIRSAS